jgi:micrococcal nuclease
MLRDRIVCCWVALLLWPANVRADEFKGKVMSVLEGDLLTVARESKPVKLRLLDADCPEKGQPHAAAATALTSKLVLGKTVLVSGFTDSKGQLVGKVSYEKIEVIEVMRGDKVVERRSKVQASLEEELVRQGLAWSVPGHEGGETIRAVEKQAQDEKRGLWADAGPVAPWDWRQGKRTAAQPTSIRIINRTAATKVVDLTEDRPVLSCQAKARAAGEKWDTCVVLPPFCTEACAKKSCPECAKPRPNLVNLAAGKSVELPWTGKLYRVRSFEHRNGNEVFKCNCHEAHEPAAGRYRIGLCLEPRGRGGPKECFSAEVQLPGTRAIEIAITR